MIETPRVYLDTNVFIGAFETNTAVAEPFRNLLTFLRGKAGVAVTSELTLAELIAPVDRPNVISQVTRKRLYMNLLVVNRFIDLRPVSRDVLWDTGKCRRHLLDHGRKLKLPDAIHITTALKSNCRYMICDEGRFTNLPLNLKVVSSNPDEIENVMRALDA